MAQTIVTYNGSTISDTDEASPVAITYGNRQITTVSEGETKTLYCNGKIMRTDLGIGLRNLLCRGKKMLSDITVEVVEDLDCDLQAEFLTVWDESAYGNVTKKVCYTPSVPNGVTAKWFVDGVEGGKIRVGIVQSHVIKLTANQGTFKIHCDPNTANCRDKFIYAFCVVNISQHFASLLDCKITMKNNGKITEFGDNTFNGFLADLVIPASVTTIGNAALKHNGSGTYTFLHEDSATVTFGSDQLYAGSSKGQRTYTVYTDNVGIKNTLAAYDEGSSGYTHVNCYHLNGEAWTS